MKPSLERSIQLGFAVALATVIAATKPVDPAEFLAVAGAIKAFWLEIVKLPPEGKV